MADRFSILKIINIVHALHTTLFVIACRTLTLHLVQIGIECLGDMFKIQIKPILRNFTKSKAMVYPLALENFPVHGDKHLFTEWSTGAGRSHAKPGVVHEQIIVVLENIAAVLMKENEQVVCTRFPNEQIFGKFLIVLRLMKAFIFVPIGTLEFLYLIWSDPGIVQFRYGRSLVKLAFDKPVYALDGITVVEYGVEIHI